MQHVASCWYSSLVRCVVRHMGGHSTGFASACLWLDWFERNQDSFYSSGWFLKIHSSSSASGFALVWVNVKKDSLVSLWDIKDGCIKGMGPSWVCKPLYRCRILCWEDYWVNTHCGQRENRAHHIHLRRWLLPGHVQCSLWPKGSKLGLTVPRGESRSPDPLPTFILQADVNLRQLWCRNGCASQNPVTPPVNTVGISGDVSIQCNR